MQCPVYYRGFILTPVCISNRMFSKVWEERNYPFSNSDRPTHDVFLISHLFYPILYKWIAGIVANLKE